MHEVIERPAEYKEDEALNAVPEKSPKRTVQTVLRKLATNDDLLTIHTEAISRTSWGKYDERHY